MRYFFTKLTSILLSLRLTVISLFLLSVVVFVGTIYQKEFGLYAAQEEFYYSWLTPLYGFIPPMPGGLLLLWVIFFNLLLSMMIQFQYGWRKVGIVLIHFGILLMLAGGWITHLFGQEGYLTLQEGEASNLASHYRDWELSVWTQEGPVREVQAVDQSRLAPGQTVRFEELGLTATVRESWVNARAYRSADRSEAPALLNAMGIVRLEKAETLPDPESHMPGLRFTAGLDGATHEVLLFGGDERPVMLHRESGDLYLQLRRIRQPLPALIQLIDFVKTVHPGSNTPKSFSSRIQVTAHDFEREALIEMNRPFRYLGFTFFQASYSAPEGQKEISTFAVTRNYGRLIPYVATGLTVVGLILHFLVECIRRRPKKRAGV